MNQLSKLILLLAPEGGMGPRPRQSEWGIPTPFRDEHVTQSETIKTTNPKTFPPGLLPSIECAGLGHGGQEGRHKIGHTVHVGPG